MTLWLDNERDLSRQDLVRMNIGKQFWGVSFSQIPDTVPCKKDFKKYLDKLKMAVEHGYGLYLYGGLRQGKTSMAVIVAKRVVALGGTAYFIRADDIQRAVIEKKMFDDEMSIEERMNVVDILIIDELGGEHSGGFGESQIERFVRYRYDHNKVLVVTTNRSKKDIQKKYGEGVLEVMESMMCPMHVDGAGWKEREMKKLEEFINES